MIGQVNVIIDSTTQLVIAITALVVALPTAILTIYNLFQSVKAKALALKAQNEVKEVKTEAAVANAKTDINTQRITNVSQAQNTMRSDITKNTTSPEIIHALLNATPGTKPESKTPEVSHGKEADCPEVKESPDPEGSRS